VNDHPRTARENASKIRKRSESHPLTALAQAQTPHSADATHRTKIGKVDQLRHYATLNSKHLKKTIGVSVAPRIMLQRNDRKNDHEMKFMKVQRTLD